MNLCEVAANCASNSNANEEVAIKKIGNAFENRIDAKRTLREIIKIKDIVLPLEKENFSDVYIVYALMDYDLHQIIRSTKDLTDYHCQPEEPPPEF